MSAAASYNAGVEAVRAMLATLAERVIRADLGARQKQLIIELLDETVAQAAMLRMRADGTLEGEPEPPADGAPAGPDGGGAAGGGAVMAMATEDAAA